MPREAKPIKLSKKERAELNALTRKRNLAQGFVRRVRIVLLADEGFDNLEIAARLALHRNSIGKWRSRYLCDGIAGLDDKPRPGQPLKYSPSRIQKVVTKVCSKPPKGMSRWSHTTLAKALHMPRSVVQRILKKYDLHPHRLRTFNFSPDPEFESKLLEVVGLYMSPPQNAVVICMDEKTGIQALDRTQPMLALRSKQPKTWTNEYVRHGTRTMLAALDIVTGKVTTWVNKTRKSADFVTFMNKVVKVYPKQRLYVIMDNLNTHKGKAAQEWLEDHPKVSFHFTPTHASWVNLAECFFSILTRQGLQHSVHRSVRELTKFLDEFVEQYNESYGPFIWTKGPEKLKRIIELTRAYQDSMHTN
jgi:transposase